MRHRWSTHVDVACFFVAGEGPEALCVLADVVDAVVGGETLGSVHTWMAPNGTTLSTLTINQMTAVSLRRWRGSGQRAPIHGS